MGSINSCSSRESAVPADAETKLTKKEHISAIAFPKDEFAEAQFVRTLGHASMGGADVKECFLAAHACGSGTDGGLVHSIWSSMAGRLLTQGKASLAAGEEATARSALLRAANYYRHASYHIFEDFKDERLKCSVRTADDAWTTAAPLCGMTKVEIPMRDSSKTMRGFIGKAAKPPARFSKSPLAICTNGYDADTAELFLWTRTLLDSGFNLLIYDGPGQGHPGPVFEGSALRHDWECVLGSVIDWALSHGGFRHKDGLLCYGLSFGGHLVTRCTLHEHRPHVYLLDPANSSVREGISARLPGPLDAYYMQEASADEKDWTSISDQSIVVRMLYKVVASKAGKMLKRKAQMHGIDAGDELWLDKFIREASKFHNDQEDFKAVQRPIVMLDAEHEPVAAGYADKLKPFLDASPCGAHHKIIRFYASEGAGDHCEAGARCFMWARTLGEVLPLLKEQLDSHII